MQTFYAKCAHLGLLVGSILFRKAYRGTGAKVHRASQQAGFTGGTAEVRHVLHPSGMSYKLAIYLDQHGVTTAQC